MQQPTTLVVLKWIDNINLQRKRTEAYLTGLLAANQKLALKCYLKTLVTFMV